MPVKICGNKKAGCNGSYGEIRAGIFITLNIDTAFF